MHLKIVVVRNADAPIRFITDDATSFVNRELRRKKHFDGVMLDPQNMGVARREKFWRIEDHLTPLLKKCYQLLSKDALFMVLTIYAIRASSLAAHYALADLFSGMGGVLESGELAVRESSVMHGDPTVPPRRTGQTVFVSQANFARWQSDLAVKKG